MTDDYTRDPYWRSRPFSPAQLLVYDIGLEDWRGYGGPLLEAKEILSSTLVPDKAKRDELEETLRVEKLTSRHFERQKLEGLKKSYGWMNALRLKGVQTSVGDDGDGEGVAKCRWVHIYSKFPEYLQGCFFGMSDWKNRPTQTLTGLRRLEHLVSQHERFSKHGKFFTPFFEPVYLDKHDGHSQFLLSVPFLDWGVEGAVPPLRFQVDRREGYASSRGTVHRLRSILQHFYRLEETADRERDQVYARHKPWNGDKELDIKVRGWYGYYPCRLNVDELWILVVDERHIVTFSSNQSWKSRYPPNQVPSRIAEVSFRTIRNMFFSAEEEQEYTAAVQAVACLSGAVGLLHRGFWNDIMLCLTDRYADYLGHLQYRLHRSPNTKLVMELLQVQEELNIVIHITQQQVDVLSRFQSYLGESSTRHSVSATSRAPHSPRSPVDYTPGIELLPAALQTTFRPYSALPFSDPMTQLLDTLKRELADLKELRDNCNNLVNRTVQLVNIRLEDHGKAILVFTLVTIVFLPLSFVTSFFGMNVSDIRDMNSNQSVFWIVAATVTSGVVGFATFLAFYGSAIMDAFLNWRDKRTNRTPRFAVQR